MAGVPRIGSLLKRYRQEAGLTQEALAEQAGLSVRGIQDLERGVSRTPRRDTVDLLATALALAERDRAELATAAGLQTRAPSRSVQGVRSVHGSPISLVGRGRELLLLAQFLSGEGDAPETAPMLLLSGEPGIGKTRLLQEAAAEAVTKGWRVLMGGCSRLGGRQPYAPLLDAFTRYLDVLTEDRLPDDLAECVWLARLLPELAGVLEPPSLEAVSANQERRLMFAAVVRFLRNVAGPGGTLLILDDLQWAGPDALDLLSTLVRLAGSGPPQGLSLRVVGAYRDTEIGPADPFGLLLSDLAQGGLVRPHELSPLDPVESGALLANLLTDAEREKGSTTIERVLERAEGIPFFLVSYAQALQTGNHEAVPWNLAQGVRQRVAVLPASRDLLGAAAIMGRRVPRALLASVLGQPEETVLTGLEAACKARLLLEEGEDSYVFAHEVIREVVETDLGAARRALLHRRVAEVMERDPVRAPAELLAYHYSRSDAQDKALQYLALAGDHAAAQYAHSIAESHYHGLLDQQETLDDNRPNPWGSRVNA